MTIRVLVVDDSDTVRNRIVEILQGSPGFQVVGQARDAATAVRLCATLCPSVMTLDLVLPDRDGLEVTREVMDCCPVPILVVSSRAARAGLVDANDVLAAGAMAVLDKPEADTSPADWERDLVRQLRILAGVPAIRRIRRRSSDPPSLAARSPRLVVLGASTGGPAAVHKLLELLPQDFTLPIVAVIHTATGFDERLATWMDGTGGARVTLAEPGPLPKRGQKQLLLARAGSHLVLRRQRLVLSGDPPIRGCRPSVDALFGSAAEALGAHTVGCLLTGMGSDGADGLRKLRDVGATTLAQAPESCVVGSMPRAAMEAGAAAWVGDLPSLARCLQHLAVEKAS